MSLVQHLINGLQIGAIYALIALGYSMVYGVAKLVNFAHGDIIMVGAYCAWFLYSNFNINIWAIIIITILTCSLLGFIIEKVAYKPLRNAPKISLIITSIAISLLLQNVVQLIFTATPRMFVSIINGSYSIGGVNLKYTTILTVFVSAILMAILTLLIKKTKMGRAIRAVSEDTATAKLVGVNVNTVISIVFAIGSGLAAIASIFYCCSYPQIIPTMGYLLGIKAFIAAVIGGIGSLEGAVLGGFIIGFIEALTKGYINSAFADAIVFGVLIIFLIIKPTGILGMKINEKV